MPKSQGSLGKEVTVSSDGLVSSEEIVKGKGRVSTTRPKSCNNSGGKTNIWGNFPLVKLVVCLFFS